MIYRLSLTESESESESEVGRLQTLQVNFTLNFAQSEVSEVAGTYEEITLFFWGVSEDVPTSRLFYEYDIMDTEALGGTILADLTKLDLMSRHIACRYHMYGGSKRSG